MDWRAWLEERDIPYADEGDQLVIAHLSQMTLAQTRRLREIFLLRNDEIAPHLTSEWRGDHCHYVILVDGSAGLAQLVRAPAL